MFPGAVRLSGLPRPVVVDMNRALPLARAAQRPDRLSLRVRAVGLRIEATMPGELLAWALLSDGQWIGNVRMKVCSGNGSESVNLEFWVTADAISPDGTPGA